MSPSDERDPPRRTSENHWRPFHWLRRVSRRVVEPFLNCLRANFLVRALLPRWFRARQQPSNGTFAELLETLRSQKPGRYDGVVDLVVAVIAVVHIAIVVASCWSIVGPHVGAPGRVITTGANESTTEQLPDGSTLSLGARSTVRVHVTAQRRTAYLEAGEAIFNVAQETRPFVVETFLANVTAGGAKFRITIDFSVEIEVFEGIVQVSPRGAKAGTPARTLQKGNPPYRVPLDGTMAVVADNRRL